jgi:hypothetical protein
MSRWMSCSSQARRNYLRRTLTATTVYLIALFLCMRWVRAIPLDPWMRYGVAVLPAAPMIAVLAILGRYLREETDEYLKMLTMRSLLVATGALLGILAINDFLRVIAHGESFGPFVCFVVFFVTFGIAQMVQTLTSLSGSGE